MKKYSLIKKILVAADFSLRFLKNRRLKPAATKNFLKNHRAWPAITIIKILLSSLYLQNALAWDQSISLGYGGGKEGGYDYYQQGLMLDYQVFPLAKLDKTLKFGFGGSLSNWHANSEANKNMASIAVSAVLRAYFAPPEDKIIRPYLIGSFGPTYLSSRKLGEREQGSNFSLQTTLGAGSEFKLSKHEFDVSLKFVHYCNAGMSKPNQGIEFYVLSIGYLFG